MQKKAKEWVAKTFSLLFKEVDAIRMPNGEDISWGIQAPYLTSPKGQRKGL